MEWLCLILFVRPFLYSTVQSLLGVIRGIQSTMMQSETLCESSVVSEQSVKVGYRIWKLSHALRLWVQRDISDQLLSLTMANTGIF
jgi:hypothetical protein